MVFIKFNASEARTINRYMNLKTKLMKCYANLYFNRQCLVKKLIPKYADIKIPNTSPAADYTSKKIRNIRIKDEIKFLHKKKQQLNKDLYHAHLEVTKECGNLWTLTFRQCASYI
jgi:hypothetical protein